MSHKIAVLRAADKRKNLDRGQILALMAPPVYDDGRTKQCHADECNIDLIMARYNKTGTISHVAKYQGVYADFSDFDFDTQMQKISRGRDIFNDLPAEVRQEFNQNPGDFFKYVNNPDNAGELLTKLKGLAEPGRQNVANDADRQSAEKAASEPVVSEKPTPETPPA